MSRPVVVAARRTPFGVAGHALAGLTVTELAAPVLSALACDVRELGITAAVDDVILGNTRGPGGNIARVAALAAGLGVQVPGMTVDRQCGSGQAAVHAAADQVRSGSRVILAGGAESTSTQPVTTLAGAETPYLRAVFAPAPFSDPEMGQAAQLVADEAGISRERQDAYALRSHELSLAALDSGAEDAELVPLRGLPRDERPRRLKPQVLARMPALFTAGGSVTTGNSCGLSDGAAAVAVVAEDLCAGTPGLALRDWCQVGVDPARPGTGPVPAARLLLERHGLSWADIEVVEMIEAFAGQVLACTDAWGLDPLGADTHRFCASGGAIARGHPWGASGAALLVRLFGVLVRGGARPGALGLATSAVGGGQGLAMLVERVG